MGSRDMADVTGRFVQVQRRDFHFKCFIHELGIRDIAFSQCLSIEGNHQFEAWIES